MSSWLFQLLARLRAVFTKPRLDRELEEELATHLDMATEENVRRGMNAEAARREARRKFGGDDAARELHRETRSLPILENFLQDVRYSARMLGRNPLFTLAAGLSLAIGIGADTAVFTVANGLLFSPPPGVAEPGRLVEISWTQNGDGVEETSYPNYIDIRRRASTLEDAYLYKAVPDSMSMAGPDGAERIFGTPVSPNYFTVLGVRPAAGRLFNMGDAQQSLSNPVVLSHTFWTKRFRKDPSVIGQTIQLNGQPFGVVGVAFEDFRGTSLVGTDVWVPFDVLPSDTGRLTRREWGAGLVAGRLKPGVSLSRAAAELNTVSHSLVEDYPEENQRARLHVATLSLFPGNLVLPFAGLLTLLMGFVSLVLIIACANLAGVLLARATARRREIAVRLAIGAGRGRLIRQFLTETMMLFVLGGAAGVLLSRVLTSLILVAIAKIAPVPFGIPLELDARVMAFAMGLSFLASVLCGLAPALQASKADVVSTLKDDSLGSSNRLRLRHAFVVAQVALSVVLVVAAGLFVRAIQRGSSINLGFDPQGVELASLNPSLGGYTNATSPIFLRSLVERVNALPGVQVATIAATLPTGAGAFRFGELTIPGVESPDGRPFLQADWNLVEPRYFATMKIPFIAGRDFDATDKEGAQPVAIVSAEAGRRFWPGQDAVGKSMLLHPPPNLSKTNSVKTVLVIGVAGDVQSPRSIGAARPLIYMSLQQQLSPEVTIVARTKQGQRITSDIRALVTSLNPNLPILTAQTLEEAMAAGTIGQRVAASVTGGLGLVGLLLAAIGVYGVTSYAVARRTREIGIRMALGAQRTDVVNMVLRQGMSLVATGSIIGMIFSASAGVLLKRSFFGLPRIDLVTLVAAAVLLSAVGLVACYVPVRRAIRINAMEALRHE